MARDFSNSNNCNNCTWTKGVSNCFKKIGSYFGKIKNTISSFQREVNSVTENIDVDKDIDNQKDINKKNNKENE